MYAKEIKDLIIPLNKNNIFKGVFSSNNLPLPNKLSFPAALVINLSPSNHRGTHWISCYIDNNKIGYYFDSYGHAPKVNSIIKWLRLVCKKVIYNYTQIQHYNSKLCGQFASIFILFCLRNKSLKHFIQLFSKNLSVNDLSITQYYKYFKRLSTIM